MAPTIWAEVYTERVAGSSLSGLPVSATFSVPPGLMAGPAGALAGAVGLAGALAAVGATAGAVVGAVAGAVVGLAAAAARWSARLQARWSPLGQAPSSRLGPRGRTRGTRRGDGGQSGQQQSAAAHARQGRQELASTLAAGWQMIRLH